MESTLTTSDRAHLRRALELAEGGRGRVSPNPLVGAVIVRDGVVIGEGFHAELGNLHAEARIDRTEGVKAFAVGHLADEEGITVHAEGVFIQPKWARDAPDEQQ